MKTGTYMFAEGLQQTLTGDRQRTIRQKAELKQHLDSASAVVRLHIIEWGRQENTGIGAIIGVVNTSEWKIYNLRVVLAVQGAEIVGTERVFVFPLATAVAEAIQPGETYIAAITMPNVLLPESENNQLALSYQIHYQEALDDIPLYYTG